MNIRGQSVRDVAVDQCWSKIFSTDLWIIMFLIFAPQTRQCLLISLLQMLKRTSRLMSHRSQDVTQIATTTWYPKEPLFNGCFNWMMNQTFTWELVVSPYPCKKPGWWLRIPTVFSTRHSHQTNCLRQTATGLPSSWAIVSGWDRWIVLSQWRPACNTFGSCLHYLGPRIATLRHSEVELLRTSRLV